MIIKIVNKILCKIKGENYRLDPQIPAGYLIMLLFSRFSMLLRGKFSLIKNEGNFFIGKGVTLKSRKLMKVGSGVTIEINCYIDALSSDGILFGKNVSIGKQTTIECTGTLRSLGKGLLVGDNVGLGSHCLYGCAGGINIQSDTIVGNYVTFHSENHNYLDPIVPIRLQGVNHKGIHIGKNCWIGAKSTILDGVTLGDGCIVAAGSVLKAGTYDADVIYGGIPAKFIKYRIV